MLSMPDERMTSGSSLGCRVVQLGLAVYLMPLFLVVLAIGGTAVLSGRLAQFAGRIIPARAYPSGGVPVLKRLKAGGNDLTPHLAGRTGRSRVV